MRFAIFSPSKSIRRKFLPADDSTRGFDNVAAALSLSPALLEGYDIGRGKDQPHGRWAM